MENLTILNLRSVIGDDACYCNASFDGLDCVVILPTPNVKDGDVLKTYYTNRDGFLCKGFDVTSVGAGESFYINGLENALGDLHFEWRETETDLCLPQFCAWDKESAFEGDVLESYYFENGAWHMGDNYRVKIERYGDGMPTLEKVEGVA